MNSDQRTELSGDSSFFLDLLRVFACELVVIGHLFWFREGVFDGYKIVREPKLLFLAKFGVILFFFISGILISHSVFRNLRSNASYKFRHYLIDRFSRIYTGLVPCFALIALMDYIHINLDTDHFVRYFGNLASLKNPWDILGNLLMLQNVPFFRVPNYGDAFPLWSLNIEWWLYLSFGWVVFNYKKLRSGNLSYILVAFVFWFFPLLLLLYNTYENLIVVWYLGVGITFLIMGGRLNFFSRRGYLILGTITAVLVLVRLQVVINVGKGVYDLTLELLLFTGILMMVLFSNGKSIVRNVLVKRVIETMAKYSYTMYLVHFPFFSLMFSLNEYFHHPWWVVSVFCFLFLNLLSFALAYFTEMRYKSLAKCIKSFL